MIILTVVGARPQFIKAATVSRALRRRHREILIHTGQHYDNMMSEVFFEELALPNPDYYLGIGSGEHGQQTGRMLEGVEAAILKERPDVVLVYGDTNSTLAGALAAAKLNVPVAHVEAGCRSYDCTMPEEINRVVTDHVSSILFCPTKRSVANLAKESISQGVHFVGDVMYDLFLEQQSWPKSAQLLDQLKLTPGNYLLVTLHRAANTDNPDRLGKLLEILDDLNEPVIFPVHPRTEKAVARLNRTPSPSVRFIEPIGYSDMQALLRHARLVLTDSGGVQKESFFVGTPCLTLRKTTEWGETVEAGWNRLVDIDRKALRNAVAEWTVTGTPPQGVFGTGHAAESIVEVLDAWWPNKS